MASEVEVNSTPAIVRHLGMELVGELGQVAVAAAAAPQVG